VPPPLTAARLAISIQHYYREACRRKTGGEALLDGWSPKANRFEIADPLRVLLIRAATLRDQRFAARAATMPSDKLGDTESRARHT
jgi:hypothetical protein